MKQIIVIVLAAVLFLGSFAISPYYVVAKSADGLDYYELPDGTVKIFNCSLNVTKIKIPLEINGKAVSSIAAGTIGYKTVDGKKEKIENFLINGYYGTASQIYAENEDMLFNCLHNFKSKIVKQPSYLYKGSKQLYCGCGFVQTVDIDFKKIPDIKISSAVPDGDGILLKWNVLDGFENYNIYRSVNNGKYEKLLTVKGNTYTDYEVKDGNIKYYITATAGENEGKQGFEAVSVVDYFKSPTFTLDSTKKGIKLSWSDSDRAVKYRVYKKSNGTDAKIYESADASVNTFIDESVKKQSEYFYSVVAVDNTGRESARFIEGKGFVFGREAKVVYLTFDDGPSENTLEIIKILKRYNAKATFFVTGNGEEEYMKNIVKAGHTIALHTYSHDYDDLYASTSDYYDDLEKIHSLVLEQTGIDTKIIRFPGGSSNTISANYSEGIMSRLTKSVQENGYRYFDWNVNSGDAEADYVSPGTILNNVVRESNGLDRCVVLMHDTKAKTSTVEALNGICAYYKKQGYEFDSLSMDSLPCHQNVNN